METDCLGDPQVRHGELAGGSDAEKTSEIRTKPLYTTALQQIPLHEGQALVNL